MPKRQPWPILARGFLVTDGIIPITREERSSVMASINGIDNSDPMGPHGLRPLPDDAIRAYYDARASTYERTIAAFYDYEIAIVSFLARRIEQLQPKRVVEGGCGVGLALAFLAKMFSEITFVGYDVSPNMIERATQRMRVHGLNNVTLVNTSHAHVSEHGDANHTDFFFTKCSFDAGEFPVLDDCEWEQRDAIYASDPIMQRWQETLSVFRLILRPRGWYFHVGRNCAGGIRMIVDVAERNGFRFRTRRSRIFTGEMPAPSSIYAKATAQFVERYDLCQAFPCALVFQRIP